MVLFFSFGCSCFFPWHFHFPEWTTLSVGLLSWHSALFFFSFPLILPGNFCLQNIMMHRCWGLSTHEVWKLTPLPFQQSLSHLYQNGPPSAQTFQPPHWTHFLLHQTSWPSQIPSFHPALSWQSKPHCSFSLFLFHLLDPIAPQALSSVSQNRWDFPQQVHGEPLRAAGASRGCA